MASGRQQVIGSASARFTIDLSQAQASVAQAQRIAAQITEAIETINKASSNAGVASAAAVQQQVERIQQQIQQTKQQSSSGAGSPNSFGVSTDLDQSMQKEMAAVQKLAAQRQADLQSQATAVQKLDNQRQSAIAAEAAAQNKQVNEALSGWDKYAAEQTKAHTQRMADLAQEVEQTAKSAGASQQSAQPINQAALGKSIARSEADQEAEDRAYLQDQIKTTQALLTQARAEIAAQAGQFQTALATAPANTDQSGVREQINAAKQPVLELQADLKELQAQYQSFSGNTGDQLALTPQFEQLRQEAQALISGGFTPLEEAVASFNESATAGRSGWAGYFNSIREGLEELNEQSLAANLQEISFRLLPAGLAAGAATKQGIDTAQTLQETNLNFTAITGSQQQAVQLMTQLTEQAQKLGLPMTTVLTTMQRFVPTVKEAGGDISQVVDLASRLLTISPDAGFETAIMAITKGLGGTDRSLLSQFNILPDTISKAEKETGSFSAGLDKVLNDMGRTSQLAQQFGQDNASAMTRFGDSINRFLASAMTPYLNAMTQAANAGSDFFNGLAQSVPIVGALTGGVLLLVNGLTSALITIGQVGLGIKAIQVLLPGLSLSGLTSGVGASVTNLLGSIDTAIASSLPVSILSAFDIAAADIATVISTATSIGITAGIAGLVIGGGVAVGVGVSAALGVGGTNDIGEQFNRLKEILFTAIAALAEPFFMGVALIQSAISGIVAAIDLVGTTIGSGVNDLMRALGGVVAQLGDFKIGNTTFHNAALQAAGANMQAQADANDQSYIYGTKNGVPYSTSNVTDEGKNGNYQGGYDYYQSQIAASNKAEQAPGGAGITYQYVEGYTDRIKRLNEVLQAGGNAADIAANGQSMFQNFIKGVLGFMFPQTAPAATGTGGISGGTGPDNTDDLEKVYGAAVQNMIAVTRELEDRTTAAARAQADFDLSRSRETTDYQTQQTRSLQDFQAQQAKSAQQANEQLQKADQQAQQQRTKQQDDYNTQEARAQQDHLIQMQRTVQDIDDAISARDFLTAQKDLEKQAQDEQDFQIADARRKADFDQQLSDLNDNLAEQRQEKLDAQKEQSDDAVAAFQLQQQRAQSDFQLRLSREDQDRSIQQARQQQDYAIQDARRQQDYALQLAQLANHNDLMTQIWNEGMGSIRTLTQQYFAQIGANVPVPNIGNSSVGSGAAPTYGSGTPLNDPDNAYMSSYYYNPVGTSSNRLTYAAGTLDTGSKAHMAQIDPHEIITPMPYADAVRAAMTGGSSGGGNLRDIHMNVPIDARGSVADVDALIGKVEDEMIPKVVQSIQNAVKASQIGRDI